MQVRFEVDSCNAFARAGDHERYAQYFSGCRPASHNGRTLWRADDFTQHPCLPGSGRHVDHASALDTASRSSRHLTPVTGQWITCLATHHQTGHRRYREAEIRGCISTGAIAVMSVNPRRRPVWLSALLAILTLMSCTTAYAMKSKFPAADFFSGPQLDLALAIERGDTDQVKLLASRTDLNAFGRQKMTLLFFALQEALQRDPRRLSIVSMLVRAGADPLQEVPDYGDPLGVVLNSSHSDFLRALLEGGLSPDTMISGRRPAIFLVTHESTFDSLKLLVERGADVNQRDSLRNSALYEALTGYSFRSIDFLLDHGADPNTYNVNGISFPSQLKAQIERQADGSSSRLKLDAIRNRLIKSGVKWPPETPEQIRSRWGANPPRRLDDSTMPL
jgi:uncharacterized protein